MIINFPIPPSQINNLQHFSVSTTKVGTTNTLLLAKPVRQNVAPFTNISKVSVPAVSLGSPYNLIHYVIFSRCKFPLLCNHLVQFLF